MAVYGVIRRENCIYRPFAHTYDGDNSYWGFHTETMFILGNSTQKQTHLGDFTQKLNSLWGMQKKD